MKIVDEGQDIIITGLLRSLTCDSIAYATVQIYEENIFVTSTTTDAIGKFKVIIPSNNSLGVRNFKVVYDGDDNYYGTESIPFSVETRETPKLKRIYATPNKNKILLGERIYLNILCKSQYGDSLSNIPVNLIYDNEIITNGVSNKNGELSLKWTPSKEGNYSLQLVSENVSTTVEIIVQDKNIYEILAELYDKTENCSISTENLEELLDLSDYLTTSEIENKYSQIEHNHDDRYYTESEINQLLSSYALSSQLNNYYSKTESDNTFRKKSDLISSNDVQYRVEGNPLSLTTVLGQVSSSLQSKQASIDDLEDKLNDKVDKVTGKGLSSNDYTTPEKNKLNGIEAGANKTVVDSSLSTTSTNPVQNKAITQEIYNATSPYLQGTLYKMNVYDYTNNSKGNEVYNVDVGQKVLVEIIPVSFQGIEKQLPTENIDLVVSDNSGTSTVTATGYDDWYTGIMSWRYVYTCSSYGLCRFSIESYSSFINIGNPYPVGAVYMSLDSTNPATLFGGVWEQLQNRFLLGAGTKNVGSTGGEENHTLSVNEMPSHTHTQNSHSHYIDGVVSINSSVDWGYSSKRQMSSTSGNYYYPYSNSNTGGIGETKTSNGTTATNQNTGGGQSHNNMPPYLVVYMWKRIS